MSVMNPKFKAFPVISPSIKSNYH